MEKLNLYREIKSIDEYVQKYISKYACSLPRNLIVQATRDVINDIKSKLDNESDESSIKVDNILKKIDEAIKSKFNVKYHRVINATGTILHTNLGRALLSKNVADKVYTATTNYIDLEVDIKTGKRTTRGNQIVKVLRQLTGCEDAIIVNNNAAAMFFILSVFSKNKEVIISRGELVEIGGSFRIPDVMAATGAILHEVGTTNKTRVSDYENALNDNTSMIMKVHTSNYKIVGFTSHTELKDLKNITEKNNLMLVHDVGSGSLINLNESLDVDEPNVIDSIRNGCDLVCFSGDKLLGSSQAGIIIGKQKYIHELKNHPLMRVLRVDKITMVSVLETLKEYLNHSTVIQNIPTLNMLYMNQNDILERASYFSKRLLECNIANKIEASNSTCGGGSIPEGNFPTYIVQLTSSSIPAHIIQNKLRNNDIPIVTRIVNNLVSFDLRTVKNDDIALIVKSLKGIYNE